MSAFDIVIVILLTLIALNGLRQGLMSALANLIGWLLAFILAVRFSDQVKPFMVSISSDPLLQQIAAFILIIVVVMLITWFVGYVLQTLFKHLKLSWLNRLAGGVFGLGKSLVVFLITIHALDPLLEKASFWKSSKVISHLSPYASVTTEYSKNIVQKTTEELDRYQSDENKKIQDDIIQPSTSQSKNQVDNPFL